MIYSENLSSDKYKRDFEMYQYAKKYLQYALNHIYTQAVNSNGLSSKLENLIFDIQYEIDHH